LDGRFKLDAPEKLQRLAPLPVSYENALNGTVIIYFQHSSLETLDLPGYRMQPLLDPHMTSAIAKYSYLQVGLRADVEEIQDL
jgi:hypothetical protein